MIRPVNWVLGHFFRGFNWVFDRATRAYGKAVGWCLRLSAIVLLVYVGLIGLTGFGFTRVPTGFIPTQDKGRLVVNVQLPDSASLERTTEVMEKIEKIALETPGVAHTISNRGRSFILNAVSSNLGSAFLPLKPFHERRDPSLSADAIAAELRQRFRREVPEARVNVFGAPPVDGLGMAGGFKLMVEATGDVNFDALQAQADALAAQGNQQPGLVGLFSGFRARTPQLYVDVDRTKVKTMGVQLTDVFDAAAGVPGQLLRQRLQPLRPHLAGQRPGRGPLPHRCRRPSSSSRSATPTATWCRWGRWPRCATRPGRSRSSATTCSRRPPINGAALPGVSTGDVLATMEKLAAEAAAQHDLPSGPS